MQEILDFIWNNGALVLGVLFALSELLAAIPSVESNSVFQLIVNILKSFKKPS